MNFNKSTLFAQSKTLQKKENPLLLETVPWIEKYRPQRIKDMAQNDSIIDLFNNIMKTGNIPHMLFYGPPGTGKTSSIWAIGREIFGNHYKERIIEFNASDDRGINAVRDKITFEAKKSVGYSIRDDGIKIPEFKIIILDEADSMTDEAQDALRVIIEDYSSVTRFCFICNYISRMTDAIKSRCSKIYFKKLTEECMATKIKEISYAEDMKLDDNVYSTIVAVSRGDMRKAIMTLQNIKYEYQFKKFYAEKLKSSDKNDKIYPVLKISKKVEIDDVYNISATIDNNTSKEILEKIFTCKNILDVSSVGKEIINMGYPIDNIISQINTQILSSDFFEDTQKAKIFQHNSMVLYRMKECANEYIQLLDFLSEIYIQYTTQEKISNKK